MTEEIIDFSEFKYCECRPDCPEIFPIYDKWNRPRRFKRGHWAKENNHPNWKCGWYINSNGYMLVLKWDHPYHNRMGYVYAHRLVMEEYLDRYLKLEESVHHLDGLTTNNRIGNLMLFVNHSEHIIYETSGISKIDNPIRYCLLCGSDRTWTNKKGYEHWHTHQGDFICDKCSHKQRYHNKKQNIRDLT